MQPNWVAGHACTAAFALALALTACGTVESTKLDVKSTETRIFEFQDHRLPAARETTRTGRDGDVLTRLGDDRLSPSGPALLRAWLHNKGPAALEGKRVVLEEFLVQVYEPLPMTAGMEVAGFMGLLVAHAIAATDGPKVVTVRISGTVNGMEFAAMRLRDFKGRLQEREINSVITEALDEATAKIANILAIPIEENL
jgi:hypothetical protein